MIMKDMSREEFILRNKVLAFKKSGDWVHILNNDRRFYNGPVLKVGARSFVLVDQVLGEITIFFLEVKFLEKMKGSLD